MPEDARIWNGAESARLPPHSPSAVWRRLPLRLGTGLALRSAASFGESASLGIALFGRPRRSAGAPAGGCAVRPARSSARSRPARSSAGAHFGRCASAGRAPAGAPRRCALRPVRRSRPCARRCALRPVRSSAGALFGRCALRPVRSSAGALFGRCALRPVRSSAGALFGRCALRPVALFGRCALRPVPPAFGRCALRPVRSWPVRSSAGAPSAGALFGRCALRPVRCSAGALASSRPVRSFGRCAVRPVRSVRPVRPFGRCALRPVRSSAGALFGGSALPAVTARPHRTAHPSLARAPTATPTNPRTKSAGCPWRRRAASARDRARCARSLRSAP